MKRAYRCTGQYEPVKTGGTECDGEPLTDSEIGQSGSAVISPRSLLADGRELLELWLAEAVFFED